MSVIDEKAISTEISPALEFHARAALIRGVEKRLLALFAEGKLFGTVHTCIGQEWSAVAVAATLGPLDTIFTNHRGHGHYLARTDDVEGLIAEIMGKQNGMCGGRGGSQHMCSKGVFSNGIQGGIAPVAAGIAMALKLRGKGGISVVFIGDGTLGEGALYETLNIVSKWNLPLLVVLENNRFSQSTSQHETLAGEILARPAAFGIATARADIWHLDSLMETAASAVATVRETGRPFFLQIDLNRLMAHSKGDDDRDKAEVEGYWETDPLTVLARDFPAEFAEIEAGVNKRIDEAVEKSLAAPFAVALPGDEDAVPSHDVKWKDLEIPGDGDRQVNLLHAALKRNMEQDPTILLIGEDIEGPYGGAFKATKNLSKEFPGRVRNTPISELSIVGIGNGLALHGYKPVVEIMFGDFVLLCADQIINHASKFRYMYNDQVTVPLIVRTPMGGKRGYGPTHSQSLEKHLLGIPGVRVVALHHRMDPAVVYDRLFAHPDSPTLVIENKMLYSLRVTAKAPSGFVFQVTDEPFPTTRLTSGRRPNLTILCYGGMLPDAEKAAEKLFDEHEIVAEVICPTQLYPLNIKPILESVQASGRLLIAEEGLTFSAFGAEVIAQIEEVAPKMLRSVGRIGSPRHPIPSCGPLEKAVLPSDGHIVAAAKDLLNHV